MKDAQGHGSNGRGISKVTGIRYSTEPGSFQRRVSVDHVDMQGRKGTTSGDENNLHMGALITRGLSEGATVSGGTPAYGHQVDSAARMLASGPKSAPVSTHDAFANAKRDKFGNVTSLHNDPPRTRADIAREKAYRDTLR